MTPGPKTELKLTDKDTHDAAVERLATYLPLKVSGYECTTESVIDVLIKAATTQQTIECVCNDLDEMVSAKPFGATSTSKSRSMICMTWNGVLIKLW